METTQQLSRSPRVPIAWKFFMLLALIVQGARVFGGTPSRLDDVYEDNLPSSPSTGWAAGAWWR